MSDDIKKEYELAILVDSEIAEKDVDIFLSNPSFAVEVIGREVVEMVQLAYPIKKHSSAALLVYYLSILPENAVKVKDGLSFQANILRSLLITPPIKRVNIKKRTSESSESNLPAGRQGKTSSEISSTEELAKTLESLQ